MAGKGLIDRFKRGSATYTCYDCGKRTRDTGRGEGAYLDGSEGLCYACYMRESAENEHHDNDGQHSKGMEEHCPLCK